MTDSHPSPAARRLGQAGLLPFVAGAVLIWLLGPDGPWPWPLMLSAYAAVILSFLGGLHWGLAMRSPAAPGWWYAWGIAPSLVGWAALLAPAYMGLVVHGVMLVVCWLVDRRVYPALGLAAWLRLRLWLTGVASLCCFVGAAGS